MDEGSRVADSSQCKSPDGAATVVAVADDDERQADGLVRVRVDRSGGVFWNSDLVANSSTVAAAVDGHWFVRERHNCGVEWRNKGLSREVIEEAMHRACTRSDGSQS